MPTLEVEPVGRSEGAAVVDVHAVRRADSGRGTLWSRESGDLDVNLVAFPAGAGVGAHVNAEVDVLLVVVSGAGQAHVDGQVVHLAAGTALLIPKGATRAIRCTRGRLVYLTCHRRRGRLRPASPTPPTTAGVEPR